jgi:hypothetical protein
VKTLRNYEIRKYVKAATAEEAIKLSKKAPIIEVIDTDAKPKSSNDDDSRTDAVGFFMPTRDDE